MDFIPFQLYMWNLDNVDSGINGGGELLMRCDVDDVEMEGTIETKASVAEPLRPEKAPIQ